MKYRIIDSELYLFEHVHPSFTTLLSDNTISFCDAFHNENAKFFYEQIVVLSNGIEENVDVEIKEKNDRYFISNIPWISFTSFTHPFLTEYASIPIITTGKFKEVYSRLIMPVALQVHHSLADGYHVGLFYKKLQQNLDNCEKLLEEMQKSQILGTGKII